MKRISVIINISALIGACLLAYALTVHFAKAKPQNITQPDTPIERLEKNQPVPDFTFKDANGAAHNINDFKGKIVILNFWASWCPPCIKEFPHFISAAKEFNEKVVFVGVSSDLDQTAMNTFMSKIKLPESNKNFYVTLDDNGAITKDIFQTLRLPETILIDTNGIMRSKIIGANWDYDDLKTQIATLLNLQEN